MLRKIMKHPFLFGTPVGLHTVANQISEISDENALQSVLDVHLLAS